MAARRTVEIERMGGMLAQDGTRRRPGGVFFQLLKDNASSAQLKAINKFRKDRQKRGHHQQRPLRPAKGSLSASGAVTRPTPCHPCRGAGAHPGWVCLWRGACAARPLSPSSEHHVGVRVTANAGAQAACATRVRQQAPAAEGSNGAFGQPPRRQRRRQQQALIHSTSAQMKGGGTHNVMRARAHVVHTLTPVGTASQLSSAQLIYARY
eukprot:COSAG01_NODE_7960_length_2970_cov_1.416203_2_plen_209_part_00